MKSVIAIPFRRRLSGRTNYRRRLALLKSSTPRLVVRKTLTSIIFQVVDLAEGGDKVVLSMTSKKLKELGWNHSFKNIPAAYLAGLMLGKMALANGVGEVIPDIGFQSVTRGGKIFAAIKGARDAGLNVQVSDDVVPSSDAITGSKIATYAKAAKPVQFASAGTAAVKITEDFEKAKVAIAAWQFKKAAPEKNVDAASKRK
ncbi:50S ribosomal protein L18 [Candidatus Woesearchaeota archaeon]|nr:50S ribosomal protein L18 [Candidatus Woesearchaeota archaeon]